MSQQVEAGICSLCSGHEAKPGRPGVSHEGGLSLKPSSIHALGGIGTTRPKAYALQKHHSFIRYLFYRW